MLSIFLSTMHNTCNTTLWINFCHVVPHIYNIDRADSWYIDYTVGKEAKPLPCEALLNTDSIELHGFEQARAYCSVWTNTCNFPRRFCPKRTWCSHYSSSLQSYSNLAVSPSTEGEGDCGLYSDVAIFQENTADKDRRLPNRVHKSVREKTLWSIPNSESYTAQMKKTILQLWPISYSQADAFEKGWIYQFFQQNYFLFIVMEQLKDCKKLSKKKRK